MKSCEDKNDFVTCHDRFNSKTLASITAAWRDVIRPMKIENMWQVGNVSDACERKVVALKNEHGEEPNIGLEVSLLLVDDTLSGAADGCARPVREKVKPVTCCR